MPKYKVKFVRATFKPQLLGEKIVQRLTVNGTHCANTSRKNLHSNYWVYVSNIKGKNQCYAWEKPSGDIVVKNQIIYMHQQNMHTIHYCNPTIIWICLLANKF